MVINLFCFEECKEETQDKWLDNLGNDCLVEMENIEDNSIDMIFYYLVYGTTACKRVKNAQMNKLTFI